MIVFSGSTVVRHTQSLGPMQGVKHGSPIQRDSRRTNEIITNVKQIINQRFSGEKNVPAEAQFIRREEQPYPREFKWSHQRMQKRKEHKLGWTGWKTERIHVAHSGRSVFVFLLYLKAEVLTLQKHFPLLSQASNQHFWLYLEDKWIFVQLQCQKNTFSNFLQPLMQSFSTNEAVRGFSLTCILKWNSEKS